jgi:hypothetical protein
MSRARHEIPQRRGPHLLAAGIVGIVAVAGVAVWQLRSGDGSGARPEQTVLATADATGNGGPGSTTAPSAVPTSTAATQTPTAQRQSTTPTPAEACVREIATFIRELIVEGTHEGLAAAKPAASSSAGRGDDPRTNPFRTRPARPARPHDLVGRSACGPAGLGGQALAVGAREHEPSICPAWR